MEMSQAGTHAVENQPPPITPYNVFEADLPLREAVEREGGGWGVDRLRDTGELAGSPEALEHSERAERNEPLLRTHDRYGNRVDRIELDPSWHWCLRQAIERELHALPWRDVAQAPGGARRAAMPSSQPGGHSVRAALFFVWSQVNSGVMCPVSMTYSAIPALREEPDLAAEWEPRITRASYDDGVLVGMAMTEKQGGSDVRANSTRAVQNGDAWEITGHKWFCSYPPCDLFLTLAQAPAGLSCFLIEGRDPGFRIERLKDKLGTRSLPSSEVEFHAVRGQLVGEEGRGIPTIIRMVNHTRLDCLIGSSAGMRWGVAQALHHARHRSAFGRVLAEQPLMRNVLADLAIESEAATAVTMRVARAYDEGDATFRRIATAVMKHYVCKRAPGHAVEALECLGGNGYVEESGMPRLLRDSPLNSIWEGSGNVSALDVLRALAREPEAMPAFLAECELARGGNAALDAHLDRLAALAPQEPEFEARAVVSDLAVALQASLLVRHAPAAVSDAFCAARLESVGRSYGTLPPAVDTEAILSRALPA
jgi:putative acyl-CoA dehydrogenase